MSEEEKATENAPVEGEEEKKQETPGDEAKPEGESKPEGDGENAEKKDEGQEGGDNKAEGGDGGDGNAEGGDVQGEGEGTGGDGEGGDGGQGGDGAQPSQIQKGDGYLTEAQMNQLKRQEKEAHTKLKGDLASKQRQIEDDEWTKLSEAEKNGKKIVWLQRCHSCALHQWCTKHKETKYDTMQAALAAKVGELCGENYHVATNQLPEGDYWRIGCFDIWIGGENTNREQLFSKNKKGYWPSMSYLANKIKEKYAA